MGGFEKFLCRAKWIAASLVLAACGTPAQAPAPIAADGSGVTVFVNGSVLTMNDDMPRAEAVAIKDGVFNFLFALINEFVHP